jgi:ribosomal protein L32
MVRAKWELDSDKLPICSNCGEIALQRIFVKVPHLIQDVRMVKSNFCPNCGADMREES